MIELRCLIKGSCQFVSLECRSLDVNFACTQPFKITSKSFQLRWVTGFMLFPRASAGCAGPKSGHFKQSSTLHSSLTAVWFADCKTPARLCRADIACNKCSATGCYTHVYARHHTSVIAATFASERCHQFSTSRSQAHFQISRNANQIYNACACNINSKMEENSLSICAPSRQLYCISYYMFTMRKHAPNGQ